MPSSTPNILLQKNIGQNVRKAAAEANELLGTLLSLGSAFNPDDPVHVAALEAGLAGGNPALVGALRAAVKDAGLAEALVADLPREVAPDVTSVEDEWT